MNDDVRDRPAGPSMTTNGGGAPPVKPKRRQRRFDLHRDGGRLAIILAVVVAVNAVFWFWSVRPKTAHIVALSEQKTSADLNENRASKTLTDLREIAAHAEAVHLSIRTFYDEMLSTTDRRIVALQRALNNVGKDFRVIPERVSIGSQPLRDEGIEVVAFNFPLSGGYENLRSFLDRLERLDQFLIVREVSLRGGKEGGRALELVVNVETYFNNPDVMRQDERSGRRRPIRGRS